MLRNLVAKITNAISRVFQFILPCVFKKKVETQSPLKGVTQLSEADKSLAQIKTDLDAAKKDKEEATKLLAEVKQKEADVATTRAKADEFLKEAEQKLAEANAAQLAAADPAAKTTLEEAQAERQAAAAARAEATTLLAKTREDVAQLQAKANELLAKAQRTEKEAGEKLEAANKVAAAAESARVTPPQKSRPAPLNPTAHAAMPSTGPAAPLPSDTPQGGHTRATTHAAPPRRWPSLEKREALKIADQLKPESAAPGSYENTKFLVAMPDILDYLLILQNVKQMDQDQLNLILEGASKMFNDVKDDLPKIKREQIHLDFIKDTEDWHFADEKNPMHSASMGVNPKLVHEIKAFEEDHPGKTGFIFIEGKLENDPKVYAAVYKQNSFFVVDLYQEGEARVASLSHNALMKKFKATGPEFRFIPVVKVELPAPKELDV